MKNIALTFLMIAVATIGLNAQIGYQVAVMDQSTGQPKANKEVSVKVDLMDNTGAIIATTSQSATTNDFGVVSIQIGNSSTFDDMDWSKLPLWVSATVDGVSVGKTQVLTVPVAEHANHYGLLTPEKLAGTWTYSNDGTESTYHFSSSGTYTYIRYEGDMLDTNESGSYEIDGNMVYPIRSSSSSRAMHWSPTRNILIPADGGGIYRK